MSTDRPQSKWYMATDREWTTEPGGPVDRALSVIIRLKGQFDPDLDFILVDQKKSRVANDGQEMATISFYLIVKDKHEEIEPQLREIGLVQGAA